MARDHARVLAAIWNNRGFTGLGAQAQRMFVVALSQPAMSYAGVVPYQPRRWATLARDTTVQTVRRHTQELAAARFVVIDEDSEELLIRTFVRHDGVLMSPNVTRAMVKSYATILSPMLRAAFLTELHRLYDATCADERYEKGWIIASELLAEPFPEGFRNPLIEGFPARAARTA
jgi:hypothetical protein